VEVVVIAERVFTERQQAVFAKDWSLAPAGDEIEEAIDIDLFDGDHGWGDALKDRRGKDGRRKRQYRYSRDIGAAMELLCWYKGDAFRLELSTKGGNLGARGTWTCVIDYCDGDAQWSCVGAVVGDEDVYNPAPLAICRALLDYNREGESQ
jgi:hypothetical protein